MPSKYIDPINTDAMATEEDIQLNTKTVVRKPSLYPKPLNNLEVFIFLFRQYIFSLDKQQCEGNRRTSSVWINSTVAVESADHEAPSVWINNTATGPTGYLSLGREGFSNPYWPRLFH
ncbi:hypothetical protein ACFX13_013137 [Malus domestica]